MLRRRPLRVERTVIMGLVALASLQLLAVSQEKGWQFSLVADHEGGILGALSPDMKGMVLEDDGGMELYAITVEGDRTRVRQTRQGPGRGTTHIVDLLSGAVVATAATFWQVHEVQFIPESDEVLFFQYEFRDRSLDARLTRWRYLEGKPIDCVKVDGYVSPLVVDSSKALLFRENHERPIGRLDLEACAIEWGAPMIQEGQRLDDVGRPTNVLDPRLLLPGRARFAYVDKSVNSAPLDRKVIIRPVDDIDDELLSIEATPGTSEDIFTTANYLGLYLTQDPPGEQVIPSRELRLYRLSDDTLERRVDIGSWDRTYTRARYTTRLGTAVAGHPLQDIVAVATQSDPDNARIRLYDLADGREITTLHFPPFKEKRSKPFNRVEIIFLQFSADGRYLVAANTEPRIRVWEMVSAEIFQ